MIIAIDFDGTVCTHEYPYIGKDIGAWPVLKELVDKGHKIILFTMRSDEYLEAAVNLFDIKSIPLWGINNNPEQSAWTTSSKVYANLYIDDAALGIPLIHDLSLSDRPYVYWDKVRMMLCELRVL